MSEPLCLNCLTPLKDGYCDTCTEPSTAKNEPSGEWYAFSMQGFESAFLHDGKKTVGEIIGATKEESFERATRICECVNFCIGLSDRELKYLGTAKQSIQNCGHDINALRLANEKLKADNEKLQAEVARLKKHLEFYSDCPPALQPTTEPKGQKEV